MDCRSLYLGIQKQLEKNVISSIESENLSLIASAQCFVEDYKLWADWINNRYNNELFVLAINEYETAIVFCLQSLYKQAFTAMRACLEHTLFGIHLSTNLYQYLQWKNGTRDVYWSNLVDQESGLFSNAYFNAFCPDVGEMSTLMGTLVKSLYREFSEYIHGNYKIADPFLHDLKYDEDHLKRFFSKTENLRYVIEFCLFVRFQSELEPKDIKQLEPQLTENLGHLQEIIELMSRSPQGE